MSAKERREHLERAVAEGGTIMTATGAITRQVPSGTTLARTPEERRAAREDIERRYQALQEEAQFLAGDDERDEGDLDFERRSRASGFTRTGGDNDDLPENFPYRGDLVEGGYGNVSKLRGASDAALVALPHIGKAGVKEIGEALKNLQEQP